MNHNTPRRGFLTGSIALAASALAVGLERAFAVGEVKRRQGVRLRIGLNAYSFNRPLMSGAMTLSDVVDYCAAQNIDGLDATGYYFPGYPNVPTDEYIYALKRKAYLNGVTISGTGVRNDFTLTDASSRRGHIALVKEWIDVSEKLGATFIRVFSGPEIPKNSTYEKVLKWMIPAFQECAEYGGKHGVVWARISVPDLAIRIGWKIKTAAKMLGVYAALNPGRATVVVLPGPPRANDAIS